MYIVPIFRESADFVRLSPSFLSVFVKIGVIGKFADFCVLDLYMMLNIKTQVENLTEIYYNITHNTQIR